MTASIGIAVANEGDTAETLLRHADAAMYQAKHDGRARAVVFRPDHHGSAVAALRTGNDLHRALDRDELVLHYQPIIDLRTGRVIGFEALMRWNHPERGLLAPGEFIAFAEETGLIVPMGMWALETACRQTAYWQSVRDRTTNAPPLVDQRQPRGASGRRPHAREDRRRDHRSHRHRGRRGRARAHREHADAGHRLDDRRAARAAEPRRAPQHRRLRHRLLVARVPQALPGGVAQDRPQLHRRARPGVGRHEHRRGDHPPRARARARRRWPKGSRRRRSSRRCARSGCDFAQGYLLGHPLPAEVIGDFPADDLTPWQDTHS